MENKVPVKQWMLRDLLRLLKTSFITGKDTIQMTCPINQRQLELYAEQIDNANPSEALNSLEYICKILNEKRIDIKWLFEKEYNTIKQALLKAQEQDKILEILKKKNVYMFRINNCINAEEYNEWVGINVDDELTEEEFNLIKGVIR